MLFTGPDIDQAPFAQHHRLGLDEHLEIMLMTGQQMPQHLHSIQLTALTKLGQRFLVGKGTTLTAPQMITGKYSPLGARQLLDNPPHRGLHTDLTGLHAATIAAKFAIARHDFP